MEGAPPGTAPLLDGVVGHRADRVGRAPVPSDPHRSARPPGRATDGRRPASRRTARRADPGVRGGSGPDAGGAVPPRAAHRRTGPRRHRRRPHWRRVRTRSTASPPRSWTGGATNPAVAARARVVTPPARGERRPPWCRPPQREAVRPATRAGPRRPSTTTPVVRLGSAPRPVHASRPGSVGPPRPAGRWVTGSTSSFAGPGVVGGHRERRRRAPQGLDEGVEPEVVAVRRPACTRTSPRRGPPRPRPRRDVRSPGRHGRTARPRHRPVPTRIDSWVRGSQPGRGPATAATRPVGLSVDLRPGVRPVRPGPGRRSRRPAPPGARRSPAPSRASASGSPTDPDGHELAEQDVDQGPAGQRDGEGPLAEPVRRCGAPGRPAPG